MFFSFYSFSNCLSYKTVDSNKVESIEKSSQKFLDKNGQFKSLSLIEFVKEICRYSSDRNIQFKRSHSFAFVIDQKCEIHGATIASNGTKVKHIHMNKKNLIGGGRIGCDKKGNLYITNDSKNYCFPFSALKVLAKKLKNMNSIAKKNVSFTFKTRSICAEKKNRIQKYKDIISGEFVDYGYKKSNIYSLEQLVNL